MSTPIKPGDTLYTVAWNLPRSASVRLASAPVTYVTEDRVAYGGPVQDAFGDFRVLRLDDLEVLNISTCPRRAFELALATQTVLVKSAQEVLDSARARQSAVKSLLASLDTPECPDCGASYTDCDC